MAAGTLESMENSSLDHLERSEEVSSFDCPSMGHVWSTCTVQLHGEVSESGGYPSLFNPDTDDEFSNESSSDLEDLTRAPLLHINVR